MCVCHRKREKVYCYKRCKCLSVFYKQIFIYMMMITIPATFASALSKDYVVQLWCNFYRNVLETGRLNTIHFTTELTASRQDYYQDKYTFRDNLSFLPTTRQKYIGDFLDQENN